MCFRVGNCKGLQNLVDSDHKRTHYTDTSTHTRAQHARTHGRTHHVTHIHTHKQAMAASFASTTTADLSPGFSSPSSEVSIFSRSFNQDQGCFVCGTSTGYRVFQSDPLQELFCREFDVAGCNDLFAARLFKAERKPSIPRGKLGNNDSAKDGQSRSVSRDDQMDGKQQHVPPARLCNGKSENQYPESQSDGEGFSIVEMLYRTNLVALVLPRYSSNKVIIWDDYQGICTGELVFRSAVRAVRMRLDRVAVILEHRIFVYNLPDLRLTSSVQTISNPRGLCAVSSSSRSYVMACPSENTGEVRVTLYETKKRFFLKAHTSAVACISLCHDGSLLATASTKGTLIRIFNTADGTQIQELRRGVDKADIHSIAFSTPSYWLVVSSDKGTIHVFCLKDPKGMGGSTSGYVSFPLSLSASAATSLASSISSGLQLARSSLTTLTQSNKGSSLAFMKGVLPGYFSSEWSFAQFRLPEDTHALVAFGKDRNTVIVLCSSGTYYKCSYDVFHGGEMVVKETVKLPNVNPMKE
ncbi:hypothetical protein L7F22_037519 [Adiantum nelumboides]|nr:hypothetical protein [Adiantum nelumboides]